VKRILAALAAVTLATLGALTVPTTAFASGTVTGTITNESSVGIPGAVIEFKYPGSTNYYYGDANGNFTATPPAHDYTVYIHAPGYAPEYYDDSFTGAGAAVVTVAEGGNLTLNATLAAGSSITGTVTSYSNAPVQAQIFATKAGDLFGTFFYASTDPVTGVYTISNLAPGSYTLYFSSSDSDDLVNEWYHDAATLATATPVTISATGSVVTVNEQLAQGGTLQGTVVNTIGTPIEDLSVTIVDDPYREFEGQPDSNGEYTIYGVRVGTHTAKTGGNEFFQDTESSPFTVSTSTPSTANFVVTPAFPDESDFEEKAALSGPTSVTAGKTYTWTVEAGTDGDVYAILYPAPRYLGAAHQQNDVATLTMTIPADTPAGTHKFTYSSYEVSGLFSTARHYFDIEVAAAPTDGGTAPPTPPVTQGPPSTPSINSLASTGYEVAPFLVWSSALLLLGAALVVGRRIAR